MMLKTIAVVGVAASTLALAGCHHGGCGRRGMFGVASPEKMKKYADARVEDVLDELKATDAQRKQAKAIEDRLFPEALAIMSAQDKARGEIVDLWSQTSLDPAKVHALVDERADALRAFAHKLADGAIELHGVLTPDQRSKVTQELRSYGGK
jgi:Spy/CpxP family protein refolding chaperone